MDDHLLVPEPLSVPDFVTWPVFPFEGDLRVKAPLGVMPHDLVREGEGDKPCRTCSTDDSSYLWVNDRWRIVAAQRLAAPTVFLESRDHLDLADLTEDLAAELGRMIVRIDRAFLSTGRVGRTHVNRWGDGAAHQHLRFYGRPIGSLEMLGFGMPMWAQILPPLPEREWDATLREVATALAASDGEAIGATTSPY